MTKQFTITIKKGSDRTIFDNIVAAHKSFEKEVQQSAIRCKEELDKTKHSKPKIK